MNSPQVRAAAITAALSATFLLGACARRETAVEAGLRTQTLHVGNNAEPPDLDPHTNNSMVERRPGHG